MRVALVRVGPGLEGDLDRLLADEGDVRDLLVDTGADEVEVVHLGLVLHADRVGAGAQGLDVGSLLTHFDLEARARLALARRRASDWISSPERARARRAGTPAIPAGACPAPRGAGCRPLPDGPGAGGRGRGWR